MSHWGYRKIACVLCGEEEETKQHLFFKCHFTQALAFGSCWECKLDSLGIVDLEELIVMNCNPLRKIAKSFEEESMVSIFLHTLFYHIWQSRNEIFFEGKENLKQLMY